MWSIIFGFGGIVGLIAYANWWYRKSTIGRLTDKRIFITGTDSGFGWQLALHMDKCGVKVYAGCFTTEGAENLKKIASDRLKTIAIDITQEESVNRAKEAIENDLNPDQGLWGLVNNAGACPEGYLFPLAKPEDYRKAMEVNFFGTINVTNAFWPLIKKSSGRIVNVISIAGRCSIGIEPYTCSKHAMEPYTDGLRRWMKCFGSHVAIIEPGFFSFTNMVKSVLKEIALQCENPRGLQSVEQLCGKNVFEAAVKDVHNYVSKPPLSGWNHPAMVTDAIKHALFAKHPKVRYVCGNDGKYLYRILLHLPDWFCDFCHALHFPTLNRAVKKIP